MKKLIVICSFVLLLACQPYSSPVTRKVVVVDSVFTLAQARLHPSFYPELDCSVFSIDLFSKDLYFAGDTLWGTGSNLVLTDVFLPVEYTSLQEGNYHIDSTGNAFSALSAMNFEGDVTGTYLLLWRDETLQQIYLFPTGSFSLHQEGDTSVLQFHLQTVDSQSFDATYRGVIQYK